MRGRSALLPPLPSSLLCKSFKFPPTLRKTLRKLLVAEDKEKFIKLHLFPKKCQKKKKYTKRQKRMNSLVYKMGTDTNGILKTIKIKYFKIMPLPTLKLIRKYETFYWKINYSFTQNIYDDIII